MRITNLTSRNYYCLNEKNYNVCGPKKIPFCVGLFKTFVREKSFTFQSKAQKCYVQSAFSSEKKQFQLKF